MSYEVKTPMLLEAADAARAVISGLLSGSMEAKDANALNGAAAKLIGVVSNDVKARLAAPRIAAYEAKTIEDTLQKQLATA